MKTINILLILLFLGTPTGVLAATPKVKDPRNWPTVPRLVMDRYQLAGRVVSLRVYARHSGYFNCKYSAARGKYMAFTLMGGPLETLTGYIPRGMGQLMLGLLKKEPMQPLTVQIEFEAKRLTDKCPDQVKILKWAIGWKYPPGSISPGKPDPTRHPKAAEIAAYKQAELWKMLRGIKPRRPVDGITELQVGDVIDVVAGARLSTSYHCMYKGAARTHYGLRLHNGKGRLIHAYVRRSRRARQLVDYIALHRDILLRVKGKIVKQAMSHYCGFQLEMTDWKMLGKKTKPSKTKPVRSH